MTTPDERITKLLDDVHELLSVRFRPGHVEEWRELLLRATAKMREIERYQRELQCANYRIVMDHLTAQSLAIGEIKEMVSRKIGVDEWIDTQLQGVVNLSTDAARDAGPVEHIEEVPLDAPYARRYGIKATRVGNDGSLRGGRVLTRASYGQVEDVLLDSVELLKDGEQLRAYVEVMK